MLPFFLFYSNDSFDFFRGGLCAKALSEIRTFRKKINKRANPI